MGEIPADAIRGPVVRTANPVMGLGIHDDATAQSAGFRGGTVPGSIHLDHVPALMSESFGDEWFEHGVVSMYFREPTTHLEPVQVVHAVGDGVVDAWIVTPDGTLVGDGAVGIAEYPAATPLRSRDRRAVDRAELDLLAHIPVGERIDVGEVQLELDRQHHLLRDPELWPTALGWYRDDSPWGPPIACPSMTVETLWTPFQNALRQYVARPSVGLFGAIEIHHRAGPILAGVDYELSGTVFDVSQSPKTEILWGETTARSGGEAVASVVMMIRLLR